jgi:hypothetical protein
MAASESRVLISTSQHAQMRCGSLGTSLDAAEFADNRSESTSIVASDQRIAPVDIVSVNDCAGLSHRFGGRVKTR